jgi:hypothetical protein
MIERYMEMINYVGMFSIEFIEERDSHNHYFVEVNLRNDGESPILTKAGMDIPYLHYCDLTNEKYAITPIKSRYIMIHEIRHFLSMFHRNISVKRWIQDLREMDSFMTCYKGEYGPLMREITNLFLQKTRLSKKRFY